MQKGKPLPSTEIKTDSYTQTHFFLSLIRSGMGKGEALWHVARDSVYGAVDTPKSVKSMMTVLFKEEYLLDQLKEEGDKLGIALQEIVVECSKLLLFGELEKLAVKLLSEI